jgi:hypothetical protein
MNVAPTGSSPQAGGTRRGVIHHAHWRQFIPTRPLGLGHSHGQGTRARETMEAQENMELEEVGTWASGIEAMLARMPDRFR